MKITLSHLGLTKADVLLHKGHHFVFCETMDAIIIVVCKTCSPNFPESSHLLAVIEDEEAANEIREQIQPTLVDVSFPN